MGSLTESYPDDPSWIVMVYRVQKLSYDFLSNRTDIGCRTPGGKWLPVKLSTEEQRKSLRECKQTENKLHIK